MSTYEKMYGRFERDFFGCIATGVMVQSIVGGVAAMYVLMHGNGIFQMIQLFVVVAMAIMYNGAVLAQQKPKTIFNTLLLSLGVNALMILLNVF